MAVQIPNNTNINDVIKSTIKDLRNANKVIKAIIGELDGLIDIIPDNFDNYSGQIEKIGKVLVTYTDLIKKISDLGKIDTKHLKTCFGVIGATSEYITAFTSLLDQEQAIIVTYGDIFDDANKFNKLIQSTVDSINSINGIEKLNFKTFIKIKVWLWEYEKVLNRILDINSLAQEFYGTKIDVDYLNDNINNVFQTINNVNEMSLISLVMAEAKIILLKQVVFDLFVTIESIADNKKLTNKTYSKKLENLNTNLGLINNVATSINSIIENLKVLVVARTYLNTVKKVLSLLPDLFDELVVISNSIKKVELDQIAVDKIIQFIKALAKIEKQVLLLGILAAPFAVAAVLSLLFITIGMAAIQALMYIILMIANPVVIRAVSISIRKLASVILMIALTIASLAITVAIILIAHEMITENVRKILETILCIGIILITVVALGWLMSAASPFLIAAAAGMLVVGLTLLAIIGISVILKKIPEYGISKAEQKHIKDAVSGIMGTINGIIGVIFGTFDKEMGSNQGSTGDDGLVLTVASWILGDTLVNLVKLILSSVTLIFGIIAIGLVIVAATVLKLLVDNTIVNSVVQNGSKVDENGKVTKKGVIVNNVANIMATAKGVINEVFKAFDNPISDGGDGILLGLAGVVLGDMFVNMFKLIISCLALTFTVIAVSLVKLTAITLSMIGEINFDPAKVANNTQTIMNTAKAVIAAVNAPSGGINQEEKSFGREMVEWILPNGLLNMIDAVMAIGSLAPTMIAVSAISLMAQSINNISKVTIDQSVEKKAVDVINLGSKLVALINDKDDTFGIIDNTKAMSRITILKELSDVLSGFTQEINVQDHEKVVNNTIKFVKTIGSIKLENLQTARNMFKEMKEFSESISGNFEGLADALNEKIAPLLEELKELMGKIPESVDNSAATISGSMYNSAAMTSGFANTNNMTAQVKAENPNMSKEEVNKLVDQRMNQQANSVNRGIEMKLEELIEVLQNHSNPIPVRMS